MLDIKPTLDVSLAKNVEINLMKGNLVKVVNNFYVASNETPDKSGIPDGEVRNDEFQEALDSGKVPSKMSILLSEEDRLGLSEVSKLNAGINITIPAEFAYLSFAEYYLDRGFHALALFELDRVIAIRPNNKYLYMMRCTPRFFLKDSQGAWEDANKAVELDNEFIYGFFFRALMNLCLGNREDAQQDYSEARRLAELKGDKEALDLIDEFKPKDFE